MLGQAACKEAVVHATHPHMLLLASLLLLLLLCWLQGIELLIKSLLARGIAVYLISGGFR